MKINKLLVIFVLLVIGSLVVAVSKKFVSKNSSIQHSDAPPRELVQELLATLEKSQGGKRNLEKVFHSECMRLFGENKSILEADLWINKNESLKFESVQVRFKEMRRINNLEGWSRVYDSVYTLTNGDEISCNVFELDSDDSSLFQSRFDRIQIARSASGVTASGGSP